MPPADWHPVSWQTNPQLAASLFIDRMKEHEQCLRLDNAIYVSENRIKSFHETNILTLKSFLHNIIRARVRYFDSKIATRVANLMVLSSRNPIIGNFK